MGYHPLIVSLANTGEPLFIVNRSGSRPSHEGAAAWLDQAVTLCRKAGFRQVRLRGDTDFSQTEHLDRWDDTGVSFVFGYACVILDARYENVRHGGSLRGCAVLIAIGLLEDGRRSVLGVSVSLSEAEVHWRTF